MPKYALHAIAFCMSLGRSFPSFLLSLFSCQFTIQLDCALQMEQSQQLSSKFHFWYSRRTLFIYLKQGPIRKTLEDPSDESPRKTGFLALDWVSCITGGGGSNFDEMLLWKPIKGHWNLEHWYSPFFRTFFLCSFFEKIMNYTINQAVAVFMKERKDTDVLIPDWLISDERSHTTLVQRKTIWTVPHPCWIL